jgi:pilin isopeptide linkage protein
MPPTTAIQNPDADGGKVTFGDIEYTVPGTYTYTVTESGSADGVTNDTTAAKTVIVNVVDNGDGTLTATASSTDEKPLTFTNKYSVEPTTASFPVQKIMEVPEYLDGPESWSYKINVAAQEGAPVADPMNGNVTNSRHSNLRRLHLHRARNL